MDVDFADSCFSHRAATYGGICLLGVHAGYREAQGTLFTIYPCSNNLQMGPPTDHSHRTPHLLASVWLSSLHNWWAVLSPEHH